MNNKIFNKVVGDKAESIATNYLKSKHYKIIETNYKNKVGEIDIIAKYKKTIVFVEVKYRKDDYFGLPREAVNIYKQNKIRSVANMYLVGTGNLNSTCRFDVIDILGDEITHIENCF